MMIHKISLRLMMVDYDLGQLLTINDDSLQIMITHDISWQIQNGS